MVCHEDIWEMAAVGYDIEPNCLVLRGVFTFFFAFFPIQSFIYNGVFRETEKK